MSGYISGELPVPSAPVMSPDGTLTRVWRTYLTLLSNRTGGAAGAITPSASTIASLVVGLAATATPLVEGIGAVGISTLYARQDHVHPTLGKKASATLPWIGGIVANGTFPFSVEGTLPFGFTVNSMTWTVGTSGGSFTANVQIIHSGVAVSITGLAAVNVNSSTRTITPATAANTVLTGDGVQVVVTATSGAPTGGFLCLNLTRT